MPKLSQSLGGKKKMTFILGQFSLAHDSIDDLIEHFRSHEIEIVGKPFVQLRDPEKIYFERRH